MTKKVPEADVALQNERRQALRLQAALLTVGVALVPAFIFGEPGLPDVAPHGIGFGIVATLYVLFCALEARMVYLALTKTGRLRSVALKAILSLLVAFALAWLQVIPLLVALLIWPLWIITLLALLALTIVKLRTLGRNQG